VPYIPNHVRSRLGLENYGSDVPQAVLDAKGITAEHIADPEKGLTVTSGTLPAATKGQAVEVSPQSGAAKGRVKRKRGPVE
jgi:hypothetical protein